MVFLVGGSNKKCRRTISFKKDSSTDKFCCLSPCLVWFLLTLKGKCCRCKQNFNLCKDGAIWFWATYSGVPSILLSLQPRLCLVQTLALADYFWWRTLLTLDSAFCLVSGTDCLVQSVWCLLCLVEIIWCFFGAYCLVQNVWCLLCLLQIVFGADFLWCILSGVHFRFSGANCLLHISSSSDCLVLFGADCFWWRTLVPALFGADLEWPRWCWCSAAPASPGTPKVGSLRSTRVLLCS